MTDLVREMVEQTGSTGAYSVFGHEGMPLGHMQFSPLDEGENISAESPWGRVEVRNLGENLGMMTVSVGGKAIATLRFTKMSMKMDVRMSSGQEMPFKLTLFTDTYRHRSDLGKYDFKLSVPAAWKGVARCKVTAQDTLGVRAEDVALVLLAHFGHRHQKYLKSLEELERMKGNVPDA